MHWMAISAIMSSVLSFGCCLLIIHTRDMHLSLTGDHASGPQKVHADVVPRVGGIAIFMGLLVGVLLSYLARPYLFFDGLLMIACLLPAFVAGLLEDFTGKVSPSRRLVATGLAAACFVFAFDVSVSRVLIPGVDSVLSIGWISLFFTCFAVAGIAHALNLIDGQNGLCGGVSFILLSAIAWVAIETRQGLVFSIALVAAAANIGFLLCNYPHGKIFLGDSGAYLNGAIIAILSVLLVEGSAGSVSPWFPVALLAYPLWETLYSMLRRKIRGRSVSDPDSLHLHSLFGYLDRVDKACSRRVKTSAPRLWVICSAPAFLAAAGYSNTAWMLAILFGFVVVYQITYWGLAGVIAGFHKPGSFATGPKSTSDHLRARRSSGL